MKEVTESIGLTSMMHGRMLVSENSYWKWPTFWRLSVQATRPDSSSSSRTAVAFTSSPGSTCPRRIQELINNKHKRNGVLWTPLCLGTCKDNGSQINPQFKLVAKKGIKKVMENEEMAPLHKKSDMYLLYVWRAYVYCKRQCSPR